MNQATQPSKELVAELEAAHRINTRFTRILFAGATIFLLIVITFFIIHAIQSENQLKSLVKGENTIIERQSQELAQIHNQQNTNAKANKAQLLAIQQLLTQQDAFIKCLADTYPRPENCAQPTFTAPTQNTSSSSQTPVKSPQNSSNAQSNSGSGSQPNFIQRILKKIGL